MKTEMNLKKDYSDIVLFQFCFTRASRLKLSTNNGIYQYVASGQNKSWPINAAKLISWCRD